MKESLSDLRVPVRWEGAGMQAAPENPFFSERIKTDECPECVGPRREGFVARGSEPERVESGEIHLLTLAATERTHSRSRCDDDVAREPVFGRGISFASSRR